MPEREEARSLGRECADKGHDWEYRFCRQCLAAALESARNEEAAKHADCCVDRQERDRLRAALAELRRGLQLAVPFVVHDPDGLCVPCWCYLHDPNVSQWDKPCDGCRVRQILARAEGPGGQDE